MIFNFFKLKIKINWLFEKKKFNHFSGRAERLSGTSPPGGARLGKQYLQVIPEGTAERGHIWNGAFGRDRGVSAMGCQMSPCSSICVWWRLLSLYISVGPIQHLRKLQSMISVAHDAQHLNMVHVVMWNFMGTKLSHDQPCELHHTTKHQCESYSTLE